MLRFANGAQITLLTSWDVWSQEHSNMELYGTLGTAYVPDPNFFGGDLRVTDGPLARDLPEWDHPFGLPNFGDNNEHANYRAAGLADMAIAITEGRPHRCSGEFALHVVDVMTSTLEAGETGAKITLSTTCDRPAPLDGDAARALMR